MNRLLTLFFLLCAPGWLHANYHPKPEETWPQVVRSQVIVIGTLNVPLERIKECLATKHDYVDLTVKTDKMLTGNAAEAFKVSWFTKPGTDSPDLEQVIRSNGKKVMLFLSVSNANQRKIFYFAGNSPKSLAEPSEEFQQQVVREIALQRKVLAAPAQAIAAPNPAVLRQVRELIDATTRKETQMDAFKRLEALGWDGVPSIIMLMNDRRDLATREISLKNHAANAFEGTRIYGPKKVVDAMAAILNQITAENFGSIYSGDGDELARQNCADGWMMYLYYWEESVKAAKANAAIKASADFRTSLVAANKLVVYEGLPHPMGELFLLDQEKERKDITKIAGSFFYSPAVEAKDPANLKKLLGDARGIYPFHSPKLCGEFHPDYAIEWASVGRVYQVLICYTCREMLYLEGNRKIVYDLDMGACSAIRTVLAPHALKRPTGR